jgi:very-short-patch-repair endonuclease
MSRGKMTLPADINDIPQIGEIRKAKELGRPNWSKYIWIACDGCGKERWVHLVKGLPSNKRCPKCCRSGKENGRWKGGKVERSCLNCGKVFLIKPSRLPSGRGKFCSTSCELIYQRKTGVFKASPNKAERTLINIINNNNLPFRYSGNGDVWLGNRNPDFINTNGKKQVIEFLGTYWHPLFDGANRKEHYKQYGFDCLVIWEDEIKDLAKVTCKIQQFSRGMVYATSRRY